MTVPVHPVSKTLDTGKVKRTFNPLVKDCSLKPHSARICCRPYAFHSGNNLPSRSEFQRMFEKSCQFQVHRMWYWLHPSRPGSMTPIKPGPFQIGSREDRARRRCSTPAPLQDTS
jgi:hypothetical protein